MPIIRLIYEHGRFSPHATLETARALSGYAVGLVAYAAIKVVAPAFYALGRTRVPLIASVIAVLANLIWNIATFRRFGHVGLALGTSIAALVNVAVLAFAFDSADPRPLSRATSCCRSRKILVAAGVMAAAVWLTSGRPSSCQSPASSSPIKAFVPIIGGRRGLLRARRRVFGLEEATTLLTPAVRR